MPKAFDLYPDRRGKDDTHSPLKNLIDYSSPMDMTVRDAAGRVNLTIDSKVTEAIDNTIQWIKDNTGIDLTDIVALTDLIAQELHFGDTAYWTTWFDNLTRMFDDLDFTSPDFNPTDAWNIFANTFLAPLGIVLTPTSPLDASKLLGQLFPGLFSNVPSTAITDADANLLWNGGFVGAIAVVGGGVWVRDEHVYYLVDGEDALTAGSVRVTADGTTKELLSNAVTVGNTQQDQIVPGQKLAYEVDVLTSGLTGAGTPVQMGIQTNLSSTTLYQSMPAGTDLTHWRNAPAGAKVATLTADYEVPDDGSVTWVRMSLVLDQSATAGNVWWDKASEKLTGGLIADLQAGYNDLHDDAVAGAAADAAFLTAVKASFDDNVGDWAGLLADLTTAYQTWTTTKTGLLSSEIATITDMLNELMGIDPATGFISPAKVAGLEALQSDFDDLSTESATQTAAWGTMIASWQTTLANGALDWTTKLSQMEAAFSTYQQVAQDVASASVITLTAIINGLLGIDPTTGMTPQTQVVGLDDSLTQLGAALTGDVADAGQWAWLAQFVNGYYALTGQAHTTAVANANTLAVRDNKPISYGLDNTTESNIDFTLATSTINITSAGTKIAFVRCAQTDVKNTIAFTAATASAPTGFYVSFYKVDFVNSKLLYINTSLNLVSQLGSTEKWIFTDAAGTAVQPGDVLAIEFQVVGSGSVNVYGMTLTKPTHPVAMLAGAAASRSGAPGGTTTNLAFTGLATPSGIVMDAAGAVYTADQANNRVLKLVGTTQTVVGFTGLSNPIDVEVDAAGAIYVVDYGNNRVVKRVGNTNTVLPFTGLSSPASVTVDAAGAVYVGDYGNNRVVKLVGSTQTTLAFTGLIHPIGVVVDASGAVYVASQGNNIVKKLVGATQTTLPFTGLSSPSMLAMDAAGSFYVTDTANNRVVRLVGSTQTAPYGFASGLNTPFGIIVDAANNLYVADAGNNRVAEYTNNTAFSALVFNNTTIPYVGLETSSPPPPTYPDNTDTYTSAGSVSTLTLDPWVTHVDLIGLGGGGGGQGETGGTVGRGGSPGAWNTKTLVVGTDIAAGGAITVTVGAGGAGGPYFTDGSAGSSTTFAWTDVNGTAHTLTCAGGAGGGIGNGANLTTYGQAPSPQNDTYNSVTYPGGGAQLVPAVGNTPGGSGPGGQAFQYGWAGARGQAWTVERQT